MDQQEDGVSDVACMCHLPNVPNHDDRSCPTLRRRWMGSKVVGGRATLGLVVVDAKAQAEHVERWLVTVPR